MTCTCPTCGQILPDDGVRIDVEAGIVIGGGCFVVLPRREMAVLEVLWSRRGRIVTKDQIFQAIYRDNDGVEFAEVVESHMSKMRKKVKPLGLEIRSERFKGYQLLTGASHEQ